MSHFVGVVILTPEDRLNEVLAPFDENLETEPYIDGEDAAAELVKAREYYALKADNKPGTVAVIKSDLEILNDYYGGGWQEEDGKLVHYSNYNPRSKWDWYSEDGGRWSDVYGERQGESVAVIRLLAQKTANAVERPTGEKNWMGRDVTELVWSDGAGFNEVLEWLPYSLVAPSPARDGEHDWFEKGQMGWFGMSSNDSTPAEWAESILKILSAAPDTAIVRYVDFHI